LKLLIDRNRQLSTGADCLMSERQDRFHHKHIWYYVCKSDWFIWHTKSCILVF